MRFTTSVCLLTGVAFASAAINVSPSLLFPVRPILEIELTICPLQQRQATTITDSNGNTIANSGIADDTTMISMTMTMTEAASTSESRPPGAESSLAIIIDGSTMYEPGVNSGDATTEGSSSASASAESTGTGTSSGWGSRITQAPVVVGGVAVAALLVV